MSELQRYMLSFFGNPLQFNKNCSKTTEELVKEIEKDENNHERQNN